MFRRFFLSARFFAGILLFSCGCFSFPARAASLSIGNVLDKMNGDSVIVYHYDEDLQESAIEYNGYIKRHQVYYTVFSTACSFVGSYIGKHYSFKATYGNNPQVFVDRSFVSQIYPSLAICYTLHAGLSALHKWDISKGNFRFFHFANNFSLKYFSLWDVYFYSMKMSFSFYSGVLFGSANALYQLS